MVQEYNDNDAVHGILVQLPLPKHMNEQRILDAISLEKDVDGFHPFNIGSLAMRGRQPLYTSCTPKVSRVPQGLCMAGSGKLQNMPSVEFGPCSPMRNWRLDIAHYMRVPALALPKEFLFLVQGCLELLRRYSVPISGKRAVVLGRSNIVGMPVAHLLQVS